MSTQNGEPRLPRDPRRDPHLLSVMRWLLKDKTRTLPRPEDEAGVNELAQAIGKSPEYTRALMVGVYGDLSGGDTVRLLT